MDMYVDSKKTKKSRDKMRHFGKAGGNVDDGSVSLVLYSDDEDDSNLEEMDKEPKDALQEGRKGSEQRRLTRLSKSRRRMTSLRNMGISKKMTLPRNMGLSKKKSRRVLEGKLAVSQGLDNTSHWARTPIL